MTALAILRALDATATALEFTHDALDCFIQHFTAICVLLYAAGEFTGRWFYRWHADWIGSIDWTIPTPPAVNPLFDAAVELEQLTGKQLRLLIGSRRRCRKSELIGGWMACWHRPGRRKRAGHLRLGEPRQTFSATTHSTTATAIEAMTKIPIGVDARSHQPRMNGTCSVSQWKMQTPTIEPTNSPIPLR